MNRLFQFVVAAVIVFAAPPSFAADEHKSMLDAALAGGAPAE